MRLYIRPYDGYIRPESNTLVFGRFWEGFGWFWVGFEPVWAGLGPVFDRF